MDKGREPVPRGPIDTGFFRRRIPAPEVAFQQVESYGESDDLHLPHGAPHPFGAKMGRLLAELHAQQAEGVKLDAAIAENLKALGFPPTGDTGQ